MRATDGEKSLDDAMRLAYSRYSGERGYTSAEFRQCCVEVANTDLSGFFARAVDSREELEYDAALEWLGLRFKPVAEKKKSDSEGDDAGAVGEKTDDSEPDPEDEKEPTPGWIGLTASDRDGRLVVTAVKRGTIAFEVGLNVGDELVAVNRYRITGSGWKDRMKQYPPGETVNLLVSRRGELMAIPVTLGEKPKESWALEVRKDATPTQLRQLAAWLGEAGDSVLEMAAEAEKSKSDSSDDGEG